MEKSKAEVLKLQNQIDNFPPKSNRLVETAKEQKAVVVDSETQMDKTFRDIVQEQADMLLKEKVRCVYFISVFIFFCFIFYA